MESKKTAEDEIDLNQLFAKIGDFFRGIGHGIISFAALLRNIPLKHKWLFISMTIIGGAVSYYYASYLRKKFYESSMILSSDYLNKRIMDNAIEKLNHLASEQSPRGLAKSLVISDTLAENIDRFDAKPFVAESDLIELEVLKEQLKNAQLNSKNEKVIEQVVKRIEIENRHAFELTVRTYSATSIKPLQVALVNYFKNNSYIQKRVEINRLNLQARKSKLLHDSQKLDSLKKIIYSNYRAMAEQGRQGSNNVILSDKPVTNPIDVYTQGLRIYDALEEAEKDIYLQKDFEVVDGFTEFSEPASARRSQIILTGMLIGFALGYVVVALTRLNKYLSTIEE
jgi:hypothetical protein